MRPFLDLTPLDNKISSLTFPINLFLIFGISIKSIPSISYLLIPTNCSNQKINSISLRWESCGYIILYYIYNIYY